VLARDGIEQARMQINPQEMGPIGVQLTVMGQQVQVEFVSEHARTRQVLEQSLQQLASALGEAGLTMTGGGVFQQAREGRGGSREGSPDDRMASRLDATGPLTEGDALRDPASALRPRVQRGLVDLYA
jgi:flagellar hook-length control protein FliK